MLITGYLSILVAIAGALAFALASNGKISELGRIAFAMGLLAFLLHAGGKTIELLK